jgi:type VI secretion system VasD/TssJ family lipoprotein
MRRAIRAALACALALGLPGCSLLGRGGGAPGAGGDPPTTMDVTVSAADRLNPDDGGQPLPTVVRLYLLGSAAKADLVSYEELYRGAEALGADVLAADELVLSPGETAKKRLAADKPARALLAVGVFRRPTGTSWRAIVPVEKGKPREVSLRVEDYRVERR